MSAAFEIPHDEQGYPQPHDHPNFSGQRRAIRRVQDHHIVSSRDGIGRRISTAIFKNAKPTPLDYVSCDSEHCILARDLQPAAYTAGEKWRGALILQAEAMRNAHNALLIGMWPLSENVCHGAVWGKITSGQAKLLLSKCEWLREIDGVRITE